MIATAAPRIRLLPTSSARIVWLSFGVLGACWGSGFLDAGPAGTAIVYANLVITRFGVYALWGLYFTLLEQSRVPHTMTGAGIGLTSLLG